MKEISFGVALNPAIHVNVCAGGTPNLSNNIRCIPQSQYVPAWYRIRFTKTLSSELYAGMSLHGQQICREIVADEVPAATYFTFPAEGEGTGRDPHPEQAGQGQGGQLVVPRL